MDDVEAGMPDFELERLALRGRGERIETSMALGMGFIVNFFVWGYQGRALQNTTVQLKAIPVSQVAVCFFP